jgi:hypothetical protein
MSMVRSFNTGKKKGGGGLYVLLFLFFLNCRQILLKKSDLQDKNNYLDLLISKGIILIKLRKNTDFQYKTGL